jgi:spore germination protein GerM
MSRPIEIDQTTAKQVVNQNSQPSTVCLIQLNYERTIQRFTTVVQDDISTVRINTDYENLLPDFGSWLQSQCNTKKIQQHCGILAKS